MSGCAEWIQRWLIYCETGSGTNVGSPSCLAGFSKSKKTGNETGRPSFSQPLPWALGTLGLSHEYTHSTSHRRTYRDADTRTARRHTLHGDTHILHTADKPAVLRQPRKAMYTEGVAPGQWLPDRACSYKTLPLQKKTRRSRGHLAGPSGLPGAGRKQPSAGRGGPQSEGRGLTGEGGARTQGGRGHPAPPRCFPGSPAGPCP